jgi:hypothetical protein
MEEKIILKIKNSTKISNRINFKELIDIHIHIYFLFLLFLITIAKKFCYNNYA